MPTVTTGILDTGTGCISIYVDVIPTPWLVEVQPIRINEKAASDKVFSAEGAICLLVKIGKQKAKAAFRVAPKQETKTIFDTAFINTENDIIETISRQIVPRNEHAVDIFESFAGKDTVQILIGIMSRFVREAW